MQIHWFWFLGFIPYALQWQRTKDERWVCIQALYWHLVIRRRQGRSSGKWFFPLIEHGLQEQEGSNILNGVSHAQSSINIYLRDGFLGNTAMVYSAFQESWGGAYAEHTLV